MADIGENLRTFLLAQSSVTKLVGARVFRNHCPQGQESKGAFICILRTSTAKERCMDDAVGTGPFRHFFAVDSVSQSLPKSEEIRSAVNAVLDAYRGTFGDTTVKGVFCEDQSDDYEPFSVSADSGLHVDSLQVEVVT